MSGDRRWPEAEMGKCEVIIEQALSMVERFGVDNATGMGVISSRGSI